MTTSTWHIDTWDERTSPAEKLGHISGRSDTQGRECYVKMFPGEDGYTSHEVAIKRLSLTPKFITDLYQKVQEQLL